MATAITPSTQDFNNFLRYAVRFEDSLTAANFIGYLFATAEGSSYTGNGINVNHMKRTVDELTGEGICNLEVSWLLGDSNDLIRDIEIFTYSLPMSEYVELQDAMITLLDA